MKRKIKKFFDENGFEYEFKCTTPNFHLGGKGFYHDGKYREDLYKLKFNGRVYQYSEKITGRSMYELDEKIEGGVYAVGYTQNMFIEDVKELLETKQLD